MGRYKTLLGSRLCARGFAAQQNEAAIGVAMLTRMLAAGRRTPSVANRSSHSRLGLGSSRSEPGRVQHCPAEPHPMQSTYPACLAATLYRQAKSNRPAAQAGGTMRRNVTYSFINLPRGDPTNCLQHGPT
jgi:hypothetical protein